MSISMQMEVLFLQGFEECTNVSKSSAALLFAMQSCSAERLGVVDAIVAIRRKGKFGHWHGFYFASQWGCHL